MPIQLENETASAIDATDLVIVRRGASTYTIDGVLIGDILDRANHIGTQTSATIIDFDAAVDARIALAPSGATDLSWTAATRTIASSTGADAVITLADGTNAGLMASADFTKLAAISGTNTGDQTITLTGDVTGTGAGSFVATIANGAVTYAKMQATALGNVVLGKSGAAGALTEIQLGLNNLLGRGSSGNLTTITVDTTLTFTGSALGVTSGTYAAASHSHSDVVASGASGFMTGADKDKLDGIASGATVYTDEMVDDRVAALLVEGDGIDLVHDDGAGTLIVTALDRWTYVRLTSDATSSSTTAANTSLAFTPAANKRYEIEGNLRIQTSLAATGPRPALDWPTGLSGGSYYMVGPTAGATDAIEIFAPAGSTTGPILLGLPLADTNYPVLIDAEFTTGGSPSGDFVVTLASETGGSVVRIMADSFIRYREIP